MNECLNIGATAILYDWTVAMKLYRWSTLYSYTFLYKTDAFLKTQ